jgi:GntR family transcriptional regulator, arabinose operon transcriptional repressor
MKKYQIVASWIREGIENCRIVPGDKLPSESELISRFEVSRNSVRQAINELVREGLVETHHGMGSFCTRRSVQSTMNVAMVCLRMGSYIFPRIIQGCNWVMQRNGYTLQLNESWYDVEEEKRVLLGLRRKGVDGLILIPVNDQGSKTNGSLVKELESEGLALVLLDNEYAEYDFTSIVLDDHQGGVAGARHLWETGHREIGVLYSSNYRPKILRKDGVLHFLSSQNGVIREEWIIGIDGQSSPFKTYGQIRELFRNGISLPTAVVCSSDDEAIMLMYQARQHGIRIPEDLSVISFDNSDLSKVSRPRLTSIDHPSEYMGELAATMLLNQLQRREAPLHTKSIIESKLIIRDSVCPPSARAVSDAGGRIS